MALVLPFARRPTTVRSSSVDSAPSLARSTARQTGSSRIGNKLQRLALEQPDALRVVEGIVDEYLRLAFKA